MKIQDFADMEKFESIMSDWSVATGLATVAVGADGKYISECYNFTDFCIKLTRGSKEGCRRCEKCDAEGQGVYHCHAGLVDFGIPLKLNDGTVLGSVIGGQVLPEHPNEEKFRGVARELGINEDEYIEALGKVTVRTEAEINAAANLLGAVLNNFINSEYNSKYNGQLITKLPSGVKRCEEYVRDIKENTKQGYKMAYPGDSIDLGYAGMNTRRGRVGHQIAHTLTTGIQQGTLHFVDLSVPPLVTEQCRCLNTRQSGIHNHKGECSGVLKEEGARAVLTPGREETRQNGRRMKEPEEPMFTITATDRHGVAYRGRIRRLVPRECLRLQGFYDWQIDRIEQETSDSQLYKQAGNGVTVNVIEAIGTLLRQADAEIRAEDEKTKR